ncbi:PRL-1 phosphatase-like [Onthophagus taurus]|uniref:PRL-1 phosphatase-like n=1 Tax=Onthophagus taurus TaxID=166361 RepID=UPI0039BE8B3D
MQNSFWIVLNSVKINIHKKIKVAKAIKKIKMRLEASEFEYKNYKFLITDMPSDCTINLYLNQLKKHTVKHVIRVCKPSYNIEWLMERGVEVHDLVYDDGGSPSKDLVERWFDLLKMAYQENPEGCVAVHCVAGLGRAPVMVAITLIELGMDYEDAVELIRQKRRGAINTKQLNYLEEYRPKGFLKNKKKYCCLI